MRLGDSSNTKSQTSEPKAICSGKCVLAGKKHNVSREPWEFCASLPVVDSFCHQGHSLSNIAVAIKPPQTDKETRQTGRGTDLQTNKGRRRWPQEQVKMHRQWLVLTEFDLSQLFLHGQVHVFLCAQPSLSVSHT